MNAIRLPEGIETIGKEAFKGAWYLSVITITSTVKSIGSSPSGTDSIVLLYSGNEEEYSQITKAKPQPAKAVIVYDYDGGSVLPYLAD